MALETLNEKQILDLGHEKRILSQILMLLLDI